MRRCLHNRAPAPSRRVCHPYGCCSHCVPLSSPACAGCLAGTGNPRPRVCAAETPSMADALLSSVLCAWARVCPHLCARVCACARQRSCLRLSVCLRACVLCVCARVFVCHARLNTHVRMRCIMFWLRAQIKWVIQMATETDVFGVEGGVQREGSWKEGLNQLEGSSLERAAKEWLQYLKNFDEISVVFDKHQNTEGYLEKSELSKVGSLFWQQPACKQLSSAK